MADPLSVAAGVAGLLVATAQISTILNNLIVKAKSAPKECKRVRSDIDDIRNVLDQLKMFIVGTKQASRSRRALIMVDQVTATLASCVATFDSLKLFVEGLQSDHTMGILDRLRWASKEEELRNFQIQVAAHKATLTLMLIILTCQKQDDAESKVDALHDSVNDLRALNMEILSRMEMWNLSQIDPSVQPDPPSTQNTGEHQVPSQVDAVDSMDGVSNTAEKPVRGFAFEELLKNSRAYRSAAHNNSDAFSVITSAGRTATWSVLSGLSLSEMSNLAILAIPVYQSDLHDKDAYDFETPQSDPNNDDDIQQSPTSQDAAQKSPGSLRKRMKEFMRKSDRDSQQSTDVQKEDSSASPLVFGTALVESILFANVAISLTNEVGESFIYGYIPIVVAKVGVFLKEKGLWLNCIVGHAKRISILQKIFDSPDRYGKGLDWTGYTVFDAASLLLRYLKSLPQPVVPYDFYDEFTKPVKVFQNLEDADKSSADQEHAKAVVAYQKFVKELPPLHRHLLLYLLDILAVVASRSVLNHMTSSRLATLFNPGIISRHPTQRTYSDHRLADDTLTFLIENQDHFLIGS